MVVIRSDLGYLLSKSRSAQRVPCCTTLIVRSSFTLWPFHHSAIYCGTQLSPPLSRSLCFRIIATHSSLYKTLSLQMQMPHPPAPSVRKRDYSHEYGETAVNILIVGLGR